MLYNFLCAIVLAIVLGFGTGSLKAEGHVASQVAATEQSKDVSNVAAHMMDDDEENFMEEEDDDEDKVSTTGHTYLGEEDDEDEDDND